MFKFTVIDTGNAEAQFANAKQSFVFNVILKSRVLHVHTDAFMFSCLLFDVKVAREEGRRHNETSFSCNLFLGREGCHGNHQQGSEMLGCGGRGERGLVLHC